MRIVELICCGIGALFGFVETDNFALHKALQGSGSIYRYFNVWNYGDSAAKFYLLCVFAALVASLGFVNLQRLRYYNPKLITLSVAILVLAAALRLAGDQGILIAVSGTEMRAFAPILFVPLGVFCMAVWAPEAMRAFAIGFFGAVGVKAIFLLAGYFLQGGIPFYDTVSSVVDGGVLTNLSVGVLAFSGLALCRYGKQADIKMILFVGIAFLCFFIIVASFRRSTLIRTGMTLMLASMILLFVQGRLWRLLPSLLFATVAGLLAIGALYITVFGADRANDRLFSLWGASQVAELGDSNRYYEDDQAILLEVIEDTNWLGVGLRNEYGARARLSGAEDEAEYAVTEIPLHTGVYELLARVGIFAVPFIVAAFVVLPLVSMRWLRMANLEWQVVGAIAAAWLLVNGLWPYAPPPYTNQHIWVSFAVAIGLLAASYVKALGRQDIPINRAKALYTPVIG